MDFTPGAMANAHERNYAVSFTRPMAMGTRCHQLAMYVIYEAPLQMLCESPSRYRKEQESVDFISKIPTVWDETVVFDAKGGGTEAVGTLQPQGEFRCLGVSFVVCGQFVVHCSFAEGQSASLAGLEQAGVVSSVTEILGYLEYKALPRTIIFTGLCCG